MADPFAALGNGYGIEKTPKGDVIVRPPAAFAGAQAPVPGDPGETSLIKPELCAEIKINVPLSKVDSFLREFAAWMTEDEWTGPASAP